MFIIKWDLLASSFCLCLWAYVFGVQKRAGEWRCTLFPGYTHVIFCDYRITSEHVPASFKTKCSLSSVEKQMLLDDLRRTKTRCVPWHFKHNTENVQVEFQTFTVQQCLTKLIGFLL